MISGRRRAAPEAGPWTSSTVSGLSPEFVTSFANCHFRGPTLVRPPGIITPGSSSGPGLPRPGDPRRCPRVPGPRPTAPASRTGRPCRSPPRRGTACSRPRDGRVREVNGPQTRAARRSGRGCPRQSGPSERSGAVGQFLISPASPVLPRSPSMRRARRGVRVRRPTRPAGTGLHSSGQPRPPGTGRRPGPGCTLREG
jgi:hypothetical protein